MNYGALTTNLLNYLKRQDDFSIQFSHEVTGLHRRPDGGWTLDVKDEKSHRRRRRIGARYVFLGAGGAAITLLQKSGIPEADGFAGFPVSGIWLRSGKQEIATRHMAKVYGMAASGSPPMSVPHLDTRYHRRQALAAVRALCRLLDQVPEARLAVRPAAVDAAGQHPAAARRGAGQLPAGGISGRPGAADQEPPLQGAARVLSQPGREGLGVRRRRPTRPDHQEGQARTGKLEFGTEIVHSADSSIVALLGASPGASTAVWIMVHMLENCFHEQLVGHWVPKLKEMIPSYGQDLKTDAALVERVRKDTAEVLGLQTV